MGLGTHSWNDDGYGERRLHSRRAKDGDRPATVDREKGAEAMTAYRFRFKLAAAPTELWRDVVAGADRTVEELQAEVNRAVGLDRGHLWFVGTDEDYWRSDVKYHSSRELEARPEDAVEYPGETTRDAGETTVAELADELGLQQYDRICYLYDYGDEWRFYAILKAVLDDEPDEEPPAVVAEKGDPVDQYGAPGGPVP